MDQGLRPLPQSTLHLPVALRAALAEPFGPVLSTDELLRRLDASRPLFAVGDVVSMTLAQAGFEPVLFVCDFKTQRGEIDPQYLETLGTWGSQEIAVHNPPAQILPEAWEGLRQAMMADGVTRVVVDGEEDLLALPLFLDAPLGAQILYGMPNQGAVLVEVTDALKVRIGQLLDQFTST